MTSEAVLSLGQEEARPSTKSSGPSRPLPSDGFPVPGAERHGEPDAEVPRGCFDCSISIPLPWWARRFVPFPFPNYSFLTVSFAFACQEESITQYSRTLDSPCRGDSCTSHEEVLLAVDLRSWAAQTWGKELMSDEPLGCSAGAKRETRNSVVRHTVRYMV